MNSMTSLTLAANKAALKTAIDKAVTVDTSKYEANSVTAFQNALTCAQTVYNTGNATQAAVDAASTSLTTATVNLKLKTTATATSSLSTLIAGIDLTKYSAASIQLILSLLAQVMK